MRNLLVILIVSFCVTSVYSENTKDSLLLRLSRVPESEKPAILNKLSDEAIMTSPRESFIYAARALMIAKRQKDLEQEAESYLNLGIALRYLGENQAALDTLYKTIDFINNLKDKKLIAQLLNVMGIVHYQLGHDSLSMEAYNKSLKIRSDINDMEGVAAILNNLGNLFNGMGNFDKALEYYFKCLKYDEALKNVKGQSATNNNIGMVYQNLKDYNKALYYYNKAESLAVANQETGKIASILNNIGATYLSQEKYDEAISFTKESNRYFKLLGENLQMQRNYTNLGLIYEYKNNFDSSLYYHKIALKLAYGLSNPTLIAGAHINMSRLFLKLNQYDKALVELKKADLLVKKSENLYIQSRLLLGFANVYSTMGNYHKAFDYLADHLALRDSLYNLEKAQKVAQVEAQYESEIKAQRIASLQIDQKIKELQIEKTNAKVNKLLIVVGIISLLVGLIIWLYIIKFKTSQKLALQNRQINEQNILLNEANHELSQINNQLAQSRQQLHEANQTKDKLFGIIAHDMKSPIDQLRTLVYLLRKAKNTNNLAIIESSLTELDISLQSVNELLNNLISWAQVQRDQIRYEESRFDLSEVIVDTTTLFEYLLKEKNITIKKNSHLPFEVISDRNMVDFIVRNLLSNAIKFSNSDTSISIQIAGSDHQFSIAISDQGIGMSAETVGQLFTASQVRKKGTHNEKGAGLALQICQEFAKQIGGTIEVESQENKGSTFTLSVERKEETV